MLRRDGILLRQVNPSYSESFAVLNDSGLYDSLVRDGFIVKVAPLESESGDDNPIVILQPEVIWPVTYPYEWCFSQLKSAALLTLSIAERALDKGMMLKDASAYNIQFRGDKPIHIDTLSFECYEVGMPWNAYRQFCEHFLAPLALMSFVDIRLSGLLRTYLDGVPLDLAAKLLPSATKRRLGLLLHLHLHNRSINGSKASPAKPVSTNGLRALFSDLRKTINSLTWEPRGTEWADYYSDTNYSPDSLVAKGSLVSELLNEVYQEGNTCWDLGANVGLFSKLAAEIGYDVVAIDADPAVVERAYRAGIAAILIDITNPSPAQGWAHEERQSLVDRGPVDMIMALALIHHIAFGHNVPLDYLARFLSKLCRSLIIEFVPKEDSQVQRMLSSRKDVFPDYSVDGFLAAFTSYFSVECVRPIPGTDRSLYLMRRGEG